MEAIVILIIALLLVALAWKFLTGTIKTVALVVILIGAAVFVFGGMS